MKVIDIMNYLNTLAPSHYQESYDNSGLLVGNSEDDIRGVLVSLDVTEKVIEEAITLNANLIVSHHPIIFGGLYQLTDATYVQRIVRKAIKNDINLLAVHTNLDNVLEHGVSTNIAKRLGLHELEILRQKPEFEKEGKVGSGIIGKLKSPMDEMDFLKYLKERMQTSCVKHTELLGNKIQTVALCGGSGRFLLDDAIRANADIFISADFKYHEFFDAGGKIIIADIGHYESEQFTIEMLHKILINKFNTFASHYTKVNTNPVNYL